MNRGQYATGMASEQTRKSFVSLVTDSTSATGFIVISVLCVRTCSELTIGARTSFIYHYQSLSRAHGRSYASACDAARRIFGT